MNENTKGYLSFFSDEEFDRLVYELTEMEPVCYDMLAFLTERMLVGFIFNYCKGNDSLRGKGLEKDIYQDIYIKIQKVCITQFFKRDGKLNLDPNGFKNWIYTIARNFIIDSAKKYDASQFNEVEDIEVFADTPTRSDVIVSDDALIRLANSFYVVIESKLSVHKVLTWLAVMSGVYYYNEDRIDANRTVEEECTNLTLDQMLDLILERTSKIFWLTFSDSQISSLRKRLEEKDKDGIRLGDKRYGDFYMKAGPIKSISDWINRLNDLFND